MPEKRARVLNCPAAPYTSTVVKPGRSFLRRMIELDESARYPNRPIRLNRAFRSDLAWWKLFIDKWN